MENIKKGYSSLPSNYITIVDLQNRWLKQKQQQQQDDDHQIKQEEKQQTTDNPNKNDTHNCKSVKVKSYSPFHKPNSPSNSVKNPNFNTRNGHFHRNKLVKEFRAVEKASNSSSESSQINDETPKVEANHILNNFNEIGDCENKTRSSQFGNKSDDFSSKKLVKEFREVKNASNSTPEASQISDETAKVEPNHHILRNGEDKGGENEKMNSQFRNRNVNYYGKNFVKEFRVAKKASNSSSESSQLNVETTNLESNHILSNKEDEVGENMKKNSRFRKNPNLKIERENYRNFKGEKRLKEVESNVDVAIVGNDDQNVEDDDEMKTKKKKRKKNKNKNRNKKKNDPTIVDDQTVEKKGNHDEGENQTVEKKDTDDEEDDQTVVKKGIDNDGDDQKVKRKDNQDEVKTQTVEIEGKMKEVNVSENGEGSKAVIKEGRRVYGGYHRVDHRGFGKTSWGLWREKGIYDGRSTAVNQGRREVYRNYSGVEHRGSFHRRNMLRGEENTIDQNYGRSTAMIEGWRGGHRGYSGGDNRGRVMWVKKNEEHS